MAGLFGLFGRKTKYVSDPTPVAKEDKDAFFLDSDSAKTLGDIEFMRKSKVLKRSFPKTLKGKGREVVKFVSSMKVADVNENQTISAQPELPVETNGATSDRKRLDSSLDVFRKMARDLRK